MTRSELHAIVETAPDLMASTRNKYLRDLNAWIDFAGPQSGNWTPATAQAFYNAQIARGTKPQSAKRLLASVAYASKWWARQLNRPELDFVHVRHAKHSGKIEKRALGPEQCKSLVEACIGPTPRDKRDLALIVVGLETGMRRMSLASMTIGDTSSAHARVTMKGLIDREEVPISDVASHVLSSWLTWLHANASHAMRPDAAVFVPLHTSIRVTGAHFAIDRPLSGSAISKIIAERSERAGIGHVYPHMFRRTFITDRTSRGYQPHEIAAMTGHALNLGALGGYMDMRALGERIRNSTPAWLTEIIGGARPS